MLTDIVLNLSPRERRKVSIPVAICAHTWQDTPSYIPVNVTCPHCGRKLKVRSDRTKVYNLKSYYTVITAVKDYQVLRHFVVFADFRIGRPAQYSIREVVQRWLTPKGKINTFGTQEKYVFLLL